MSMHLRGSRDMMRNEDEGWWTSRTGLEQKLIILSTILFIIAFSLAITVIVLKGREKGDSTTVAPPITSEGTTVSGDTPAPTGSTVNPPTGSTVNPPTGSTVSPPSASTESPSPTPSPSDASSPAASTDQSSPVTAVTGKSSDPPALTSKNEGSAPLEKSHSSPLIALLKEANRVNGVLEKLKEQMQAGA